MLLTIIMRHHLKKMHLCLTKELNEDELVDDISTIMYVVDAAWSRYCGLAGLFCILLRLLAFDIYRSRDIQAPADR